MSDMTIDNRMIRRAVISSFLGTGMEWYDYFIYGSLAALVFDKVFFPELPVVVGTILSLLTFGIGFVARPIGAILFGYLGDRLGRRRTLIITLLVIGLSTGVIGLLPTYGMIGVAAPIILTSIRFIQGLSLGGEWGGAILLAVEYAPNNRRSLYGAMPQFGSPLGTVSSSLVVALVTLLPEPQLLAWGWRIPFLLAFVFLLIAMYIRTKVDETPTFQNLVKVGATATSRVPIYQLFRHAPGRIAVVVMTSLFSIGGFFLMTTYAISYSTHVLHLQAWQVLVATIIGALLEALGIYVGGRSGDRWQPWRVIAVSSLGGLVLTVPLTLAIGSGNVIWAIAGIAVGIGMLGVAYGPLGTLISSLFDDTYRYTGTAVSFNIAGLIGGFVPTIAALVAVVMDNSVWVIGVLLAINLLLAVIGALLAGLLHRRGIVGRDTVTINIVESDAVA